MNNLKQSEVANLRARLLAAEARVGALSEALRAYEQSVQEALRAAPNHSPLAVAALLNSAIEDAIVLREEARSDDGLAVGLVAALERIRATLASLPEPRCTCPNEAGRGLLGLPHRTRETISGLRARLSAVEQERDEARDSLRMLRDAWNAHFAKCPIDLAGVPTFEEINAWMNAPSDTASAALPVPETQP